MARNVSSATSVRAISFAENRTLRAFVALYAAMSLLILALVGLLYYRYREQVMLSDHRLAMQLEGEVYLPRLVAWMQGDRIDFPVDPAYTTAFFVGRSLVGGHLPTMPHDLSPGIHRKDGDIYLVIPMGSYGLEDGRAVMMTADDGLWLHRFWRDALIGGGIAFVLLLFIGVVLVKLLLRPMKEAVELLDAFIKDTTHELNTPVTTILTNVEGMDLSVLPDRHRRRFMRIETAAKTIGTIYDDLTWLLLRGVPRRREEPVALSELVEERLEYFRSRSEAKGLALLVDTDEDTVVFMDRSAAVRMLDNLFSNAIKYADRGGTVRITLEAGGKMTVANTGRPIPSGKLSRIFVRYARADDSRGGFGIGLHIVSRIAAEYGIRIGVASDSEATVFTLIWPRYIPRPT